MSFIPLPQTTASLRHARQWYVNLKSGNYDNLPDIFQDIDNATRDVVGVLNSELPRVNLFFVPPTGDLDVTALIEDGPYLDPDVRSNLPKETLHDIKEAGLALVFGLFTAVGVHLFCAMEAVVTHYFPLIPSITLKESQRNWGKYIELLRDQTCVGCHLRIVSGLATKRKSPRAF